MSVEGVTTEIVAKASAAAQTAYYKSFQTVYFASIAFGGGRHKRIHDAWQGVGFHLDP